MKTSKIAIGADHAGFEMKSLLISEIEKLGYEVTDFGTDSSDSVDYPDYVHPLARTINDGAMDFGVLICGSANGVAMTANKHKNVRAAIAWRKDVSALARQHNDANILCIPARFVNYEQAKEIITTFLSTPFEGGRHQNRVKKISAC